MPIEKEVLNRDGVPPPPACPYCGSNLRRAIDQGKVTKRWDVRRLVDVATVKCSRCRKTYSYVVSTGDVLLPKR